MGLFDFYNFEERNNPEVFLKTKYVLSVELIMKKGK